MARKAWSEVVDCTTSDYIVPRNVEVVEMRCNAAGDILTKGANGEQVGVKSAEYDIFHVPSIPDNMRSVSKVGTTLALRSGAITLSGWIHA